MPESAEAKLAVAVQKSLAENPELTVPELAKKHDVTDGEIVSVLDSYVVEGGKVSHVGPGAGGGWVH